MIIMFAFKLHFYSILVFIMFYPRLFIFYNFNSK